MRRGLILNTQGEAKNIVTQAYALALPSVFTAVEFTTELDSNTYDLIFALLPISPTYKTTFENLKGLKIGYITEPLTEQKDKLMTSICDMIYCAEPHPISPYIYFPSPLFNLTLESKFTESKIPHCGLILDDSLLTQHNGWLYILIRLCINLNKNMKIHIYRFRDNGKINDSLINGLLSKNIILEENNEMANIPQIARELNKLDFVLCSDPISQLFGLLTKIPTLFLGIKSQLTTESVRTADYAVLKQAVRNLINQRNEIIESYQPLIDHYRFYLQAPALQPFTSTTSLLIPPISIKRTLSHSQLNLLVECFPELLPSEHLTSWKCLIDQIFNPTQAFKRSLFNCTKIFVTPMTGLKNWIIEQIAALKVPLMAIVEIPYFHDPTVTIIHSNSEQPSLHSAQRNLYLAIEVPITPIEFPFYQYDQVLVENYGTTDSLIENIELEVDQYVLKCAIKDKPIILNQRADSTILTADYPLYGSGPFTASSMIQAISQIKALKVTSITDLVHTINAV